MNKSYTNKYSRC